MKTCGESVVNWWIGVLILFIGIVIGTFGADAVVAEEREESEPVLSERVKAIEERLDKLDRVDVIKKVNEYVCPDGELYDSLPAGGRCPDGSLPEDRQTFRKIPFSRRESLSEKISAALEEAESKRVTIGGSARGILQQPLGSRMDEKLFGTGSVDLFFLSKPMTASIFFVDLESIGGRGPDEVVGSLSRLNTDAETLGAGATDQVKVREAWLYMRLLGDQVKVFGGKVDLTNYFDRNAVANDETTKFLNTALVNNPLLKQPPNGPGAALRYEPGKDFGMGVGVQSSNNSGATIAEKVYAVAELDYHTHPFSSREGNYRLWGRSARDGATLEKRSWGVGISFDQEVHPRATAFVRAGIGKTEGEEKKAYAGSVGLELRSLFESAIRDRIGLAFSCQVDAGISENLGEGYYHHYLTDRLAVAFDLQWLFTGTNEITGEKNRNIVIPGLRTTVNF